MEVKGADAVFAVSSDAGIPETAAQEGTPLSTNPESVINLTSSAPEIDPAWAKVFTPASETIQPYNLDDKTGGVVDVRAIELMDATYLVTPAQLKKSRRYIGVAYEVTRSGWKVRTSLRGREFTYGYYNSPQTAALVYDAVKINMKGLPALHVPAALNFAERFEPVLHHPQFRTMPPAVFSELTAPLKPTSAATASPVVVDTRSKEAASTAETSVTVDGKKLTGIYFRKGSNKYESSILYKNVKHHVGMFASALEAARARDRLGLSLWGPAFIPRCNFPEEAQTLLAELSEKPFSLPGEGDTAAEYEDEEAPGGPPTATRSGSSTRSQDLQQLIKPTFKGVAYRATTRQWVAKVHTPEGIHVYGPFTTAESAAAGYDRVMYKVYGEESVGSLNFPGRLAETVSDVKSGIVPVQMKDEEFTPGPAGDDTDPELDETTVYNPRTGKKWKGVNQAIRQNGKVYQARVSWCGRRLSAGFFPTPVEAALAHDKKMMELYENQVPVALLNFPSTSLDTPDFDGMEKGSSPAPKSNDQSRKRPRQAGTTNGDASVPDAKRSRGIAAAASILGMDGPGSDATPSAFIKLSDSICGQLLAAQLALGSAATRTEALTIASGVSNEVQVAVAPIQEALSTAALKLAAAFAVTSQLQTYLKLGAVQFLTPGTGIPRGPLDLLLSSLPRPVISSFEAAAAAEMERLGEARRQVEAELRTASARIDEHTAARTTATPSDMQAYNSLTAKLSALDESIAKLTAGKRHLAVLAAENTGADEELGAFAAFETSNDTSVASQTTVPS